MDRARVFQYGPRRDVEQLIALPAYVIEYVDYRNPDRHQLVADEAYGIKADIYYEIIPGTILRPSLTKLRR